MKDCRTKEERLWEINHRLKTGLYRQGTLTQLINTRDRLKKQIGEKQTK